MGGWDEKEIQELGRVVTGKTPPTGVAEYFNGDELFVSPKDLDFDHTYVTETATAITDRALEKFRNQVVPRYSVLFTSLSYGFGKVGIASRPCITNQQIHSIVVNEDFDFRFVYYLLRVYKPFIFAFNSGIDTPIVPKSVFERIKVLCPIRSVQSKLAAVITAYDDLIDNYQSQINTLERVVGSLYREWFVRMRFPGFQHATFSKGIPDDWQVRPIECLASEIRTGVKKQELKDDELYVGLEHIPRKSIALANYDTCESVTSNKLRFSKRDILFAKIRPYLHKVALAHVEGVCSTDTIVIRATKPEHEGFVLLTVFSDAFIELATISAKGTKMPRADWDFLCKLEVPVPTVDLLKLFQEHFESCFSQIVGLLASIRQLKASRDRLLKRLFSGDLAVEGVEIRFPESMEPVSVEETSEELVHA